MASDNNLLPTTKTVTKIKTRKLRVSHKKGQIESLKMLSTEKQVKDVLLSEIFYLKSDKTKYNFFKDISHTKKTDFLEP